MNSGDPGRVDSFFCRPGVAGVRLHRPDGAFAGGAGHVAGAPGPVPVRVFASPSPVPVGTAGAPAGVFGAPAAVRVGLQGRGGRLTSRRHAAHQQGTRTPQLPRQRPALDLSCRSVSISACRPRVAFPDLNCRPSLLSILHVQPLPSNASRRNLNLTAVALASVYHPSASDHFIQRLAEVGAITVSRADADASSDRELADWTSTQIQELVQSSLHEQAQAVVLPETALHTATLADRLDQAADRPVLTATQVSIWAAYDAIGQRPRTSNAGILFTGAESPRRPGANCS